MMESSVDNSHTARLPTEVLEVIFRELPFQAIAQAVSVNTKWRSLVYGTVESITSASSVALSWHYLSLTDQILMRFSSLRSLLVCSSNVTDVGMNCLRQLHTLVLRNNDSVSAEGLMKLPALTKLTLACKNLITDTGLGELTKLENLTISQNVVLTYKGVQKLHNLRTLELYSSQISLHADIELTNLSSLSLQSVPSDVRHDLQGLVNLKTLALVNCCAHATLGFHMLSELRTLSLISCDLLQDSLKSLVNLTELDLKRNFSIKDEAVSQLRNLTKLSIHLWITDVGIRDLIYLQILDLDGNRKVTNAGIQGLVNLMWLNISGIGCKITADGLTGLSKLRFVRVKDRFLEQDDFDAFQKALPNVDISRI